MFAIHLRYKLLMATTKTLVFCLLTCRLGDNVDGLLLYCAELEANIKTKRKLFLN